MGFQRVAAARRFVGGCLFVSLLHSQLLSEDTLILPLFQISKRSVSTAEESRLINLPKSEKARRLWLRLHGKRWGLTEDSEVEVICTCTCCGDRCRMGAECCCSADKIPVQPPKGLCSLSGRCQTPIHLPILTGALRWFTLPWVSEGLEMPQAFFGVIVQKAILQGIYPEPPTPVPKSFMR